MASVVDEIPSVTYDKAEESDKVEESEKAEQLDQAKGAIDESQASRGRGIKFWLVFVALCCSLLLSALDLVSSLFLI